MNKSFGGLRRQDPLFARFLVLVLACTSISVSVPSGSCNLRAMD